MPGLQQSPCQSQPTWYAMVSNSVAIFQIITHPFGLAHRHATIQIPTQGTTQSRQPLRLEARQQRCERPYSLPLWIFDTNKFRQASPYKSAHPMIRREGQIVWDSKRIAQCYMLGVFVYASTGTAFGRTLADCATNVCLIDPRSELKCTTVFFFDS